MFNKLYKILMKPFFFIPYGIIRTNYLPIYQCISVFYETFLKKISWGTYLVQHPLAAKNITEFMERFAPLRSTPLAPPACCV